jgi:serine/threonine protein kinase
MPADLQKARALFLHAVGKLPPEQWEAYVAEACGGDTDLQRQVARLLQVHQEAGSFLEEPAVDPRAIGVFSNAPGDDRPTNGPREGPGTLVGPYKLLETIGEGGFGVVFMAEQQRPVRRKVALKVLKPGMDTCQVVARFEAERQALALMDHPNIARVFDGGETVSGRPYFVMELVRGVPITDLCDQNHLNVRQRLELFITVCQAVQHAHQKGIIHRDLKPSNVLVTLHDGTPVVKVIDFGIAKATGRQLTEKTLFTNFAQMIGTPLYMSPEQAEMSGLDIDTRSDVYSLGVLLYELLTGTTPCDQERLRTAAFDEIRRIIREEEPAKSSTRISTLGPAACTVSTNRKSDPRRLSQLFRGELDWIVMKALEKDRTRRYESASGLAADIQHYLNDEPVSAGPPSAAYRLRKFSRRHRRWLAAAAALAAALVLGTAVSVWQAVRATRAEKETREERDTAVTERQRADEEAAIARAISDFMADDILRQAGASRQASPTRKPDPDITVRTALDRAAANIAGKFAGQPRVEVALRDAIGSTYSELGVADKAVEQLEIAARLAQATLGDEHADTLKCLSHLARVYQYQDRLAQAEPLMVQVFEVAKRVNGPEHPSTLTYMNNLGLLYSDQSKVDAAEALLSNAVDLRRRALGADHPDTLTSCNNLAALLSNLRGEHARAEPLYVQVLEVRRRVIGDEHPDTLSSINNLGILYRNLGRYAEAEPLLSEALKGLRKQVGEDHLHTIITLCNVGLVYRDQGKYPEAERCLTDALQRGRKMLGDRHVSTLLTTSNLACLYQYQGRYKEAEAMFTEIIEHSRQALGEDHRGTFTFRRNLALLYLAWNRPAQAEPLLAELLAVRRRRDDNNHPMVASLLAELGESILDQGRVAEAEPLLRDALRIREAKQPQTWTRFYNQSLLGACLTAQERYAEAEPLLLAGYDGINSRAPTMPAEARPTQAVALGRIVQLYEAWGKPDKAAEWRTKKK